MIRDIVNSILINIARQYPLIEGKRQINMYAFMENPKLLTEPTLGNVYNDYVNNKFWARNWELSGADPSTMQREYPFMTLENVSVIKNSFDDTCQCFDFWIMIGDQLNCRDCPERTEADIYSDLYDKANNVMIELFNTFAWTNGTKTIYATKKYVDYWQGNNLLLDFKKGKRMLQESVDQIKVNANNIGTGDNAIAVSFNFKVCGKSDIVNFDYDPVKPENLIGFTKCDAC